MYHLLLSFLVNHAAAQTVTEANGNKIQFGASDTSARREMTESELTEKYFKKKTTDKSGQKFTIPLFYESMSRPLTQIRTKATSKVSGLEDVVIDAGAIMTVLEKLVDPQWLVKLEGLRKECRETNKNLKGKICWKPISAFADPDVKVIFDERSLEIRVRIIPQLRSKKISSLTHATGYSEEVTNKPTWISSYVNANVNQVFQSDNAVYANGREPWTANFDSATRLGEVVVEANGRTREKRSEVAVTEPDFVRENVRAVMDFPSIESRAQLGDLTYPVRSFQSYRAMAGATLFTQTSLKSSLVTNPGGSFQLNLTRPSKISVYLNEKLVQEFSLPAGLHDVRDFPVVNGLNNLKLEITDDMGRSETKEFSIVNSTDLLKTGEQEYSYSVGVPSREVDGVRSYDSSLPTLSLFNRFGYSDSLTLGLNLQTDTQQSLGGMEFLFPSVLGYYSVESAFSQAKDAGSGYAGRLRFVLQDYLGTQADNKFTSLEADAYSKDFLPFGDLSGGNSTSLKLQVSHSRSVSKSTNVSISSNYSFNRVTGPEVSDSYSLSVGASRNWGNGLTTSFNFKDTHSLTGSEDISAMLFFVWSAPKERQFVTASTESLSGTSRADWTYQSGEGVGAFKSRVNIAGKQSTSGYGGDIEYTGNRARLAASHQVEVEKADLTASPPVPSKSVRTTNLHLGTALVFAGGHFAISRPVYDSFAVFVPLKNIEEENVQINPQKDGSYSGETNWFGAAVATEVPSYSYTTLILKQQKATAGVSLPKDHFTLFPPYHAGYAIMIGTDATVYLKTIIQNADGTPAAMIAGRAVYLDNDSQESVTIFTNKAGLVRSEGFRHGRYRLEAGPDFEPLEFTIPESAGDEFELPPLKLKENSK